MKSKQDYYLVSIGATDRSFETAIWCFCEKVNPLDILLREQKKTHNLLSILFSQQVSNKWALKFIKIRKQKDIRF